ncbi:MAG: hypothetical protein COA69_01310 [Robiginitomaculum sp.]|nr:MAG: hypothetical protein COA69_01310 [Robiginitomaculum sp.]
MHNKQRFILKFRSTFVKAQIITVLAAGLMVGAVPAQAGVVKNDTVHMQVDLRELETPDGVQRVYQRMTSKAEHACGTFGYAPLKDRFASQACATDLLASFVKDLDDVRITAYYHKMVS